MSFAARPRLLCLLCRSRKFGTTARRLAEQGAKEAAIPKPLRAVPQSPLEGAPRAYGKRVDDFTPTPLPRPIGMPNPPQPGENTGIDLRTRKQRRDDFVNYTKHLERRQELTSKFARPYFRDWTNIRHHKGKTFVAPPRPFKRELSLFFPNLRGVTMVKDNRNSLDTTPIMFGRVSVVAMFSGGWAEGQVNSFISPESNPSLTAILDANKDMAQIIRINHEDDVLKAMLIKLFTSNIRKQIGEENWERYFVVRKGISDEVRENIGLLNSKVGYVYLVDGDCRIRWAGSAVGEDHEREGLAKALQRVIEEERRIDEAMALRNS
ncbi:ATP10 protein-domain-containing protein [Xylariomycetidae sp. FL0641]|nr:ATP10 protein-domain-containing protein [Xylariomycetidae sp. FL0641]